MKILLVMIYWWDGKQNSSRYRNVLFTWEKLKKLNHFMLENNLDCVVKLYDFSPNKMIKDSIHIPYPLGEFKRSEKINIILKDNLEFDYIMMFDSDAFFIKDDFIKIFNILKTLGEKEIYVFDLAKLNESDTINILENKISESNFCDLNFSYAWSGNKINGPLKNRLSGLGGVYLISMNILNEVGGFNEKYKGWGGEDGEVLSRIIEKGYNKNIKRVVDYSPYHLSHFRDYENKNYTERF